MASREQFSISYNGDALQAGLMDVRDLAPALLALGDLIQETNRIVNHDRAKISVQVRADFNRGSFTVELVLIQSLIEQAQEFLKVHPQIKDAKEILEILFFYGGVPYWAFTKLLKRFRGREIPPQSVTFIDNSLVIINIDGEDITTTKDIYDLATNPSARIAIERVVAPLQIEGIDTVQFGEDGNTEIISKQELPSLKAGEIGAETLLDNSREAILAIVRLSFKPEHKWGFSDGTVRISASIEDKVFWDNVQSGEPFSKGDQVRVMLRSKTTRRDNGDLKTEYIVERVMEHIPRARFIQRRIEL